nr:hypothetical protein [Tanacetum cinerariifolium]
LVVKKINLKIKGVLSAAKVLADAAKKKVNTYTRRRRAVSVKDKGKAIMQEFEQPKKIKKIVQIQMSLYEELAQKIHEEEQARFNAKQEAKFNVEEEELLATETTKDEANPLVTDKMLVEERESLSITKRAKLLAELIDKRKKLQAAQRYEAIRNKPQTMSQQRKTMCTSMKNMAGYKMEHFKGKAFMKNHTEAYQTFVDMLKRFDRDDLVRLWDLVKERFSTTEPKNDKEKALEASKRFDRDDLVRLWDLVKERFSTTEPKNDKEKALEASKVDA